MGIIMERAMSAATETTDAVITMASMSAEDMSITAADKIYDPIESGFLKLDMGKLLMLK